MAGVTLRLPYDTTPGGTSPNYVLSCLDCHEPHGTVLYNVMSGGPGVRLYYSSLLRKEMNGEQVEYRIDASSLCGWPQDDADWTPYGLCLRCMRSADTAVDPLTVLPVIIMVPL